ncbi:MAG TPA: ABC transporter substrate-binding protein [Alcanivorax sp.]|nr:ABC transporter substrate-binding protein [Alcanivorax sp.]
MGLKKGMGMVAACVLAFGAHAATPVKLGLNYPHTGEYSEEGLMQKRGALMAIDEINAAGGVRGRPLELIERDSASQAERSRRNVDELAAEGAAMLFGGSSSAVAIAASKQARKHDLLYFGTLTYSNDTTGKDGHLGMFRECYNAWMAARVLGDYLKREYQDKTYFYVTADYTWGHTTEASMREFTDTKDSNRHGSVLVPFPGARYHEIEEAMQAAADSDADVLVMVLFGEQMVRGMTIAQRKKLPERMQIVVPNLTLSMVEQTGPFIMAGVIGAVPWTWNVPYEYGFERGQQFVEEFSQRYRTRPSTSAASAYSIVYQWKDAVERAGSFDSDSVRRALEGHSYTLLKDEQQWRAFDHQNVQSVYAVRIKARDKVMKDEYRQNFFEIISRMSGEDAAITRSQWLAERRRAGMPEQLE